MSSGDINLFTGDLDGGLSPILAALEASFQARSGGDSPPVPSEQQPTRDLQGREQEYYVPLPMLFSFESINTWPPHFDPELWLSDDEGASGSSNGLEDGWALIRRRAEATSGEDDELDGCPELIDDIVRSPTPESLDDHIEPSKRRRTRSLAGDLLLTGKQTRRRLRILGTEPVDETSFSSMAELAKAQKDWRRHHDGLMLGYSRTLYVSDSENSDADLADSDISTQPPSVGSSPVLEAQHPSPDLDTDMIQLDEEVDTGDAMELDVDHAETQDTMLIDEGNATKREIIELRSSSGNPSKLMGEDNAVKAEVIDLISSSSIASSESSDSTDEDSDCTSESIPSSSSEARSAASGRYEPSSENNFEMDIDEEPNPAEKSWRDDIADLLPTRHSEIHEPSSQRGSIAVSSDESDDVDNDNNLDDEAQDGVVPNHDDKPVERNIAAEVASDRCPEDDDESSSDSLSDYSDDVGFEDMLAFQAQGVKAKNEAPALQDTQASRSRVRLPDADDERLAPIPPIPELSGKAIELLGADFDQLRKADKSSSPHLWRIIISDVLPLFIEEADKLHRSTITFDDARGLSLSIRDFITIPRSLIIDDDDVSQCWFTGELINVLSAIYSQSTDFDEYYSDLDHKPWFMEYCAMELWGSQTSAAEFENLWNDASNRPARDIPQDSQSMVYNVNVGSHWVVAHAFPHGNNGLPEIKIYNPSRPKSAARLGGGISFCKENLPQFMRAVSRESPNSAFRDIVWSANCIKPGECEQMCSDDMDCGPYSVDFVHKLASGRLPQELNDGDKSAELVQQERLLRGEQLRLSHLSKLLEMCRAALRLRMLERNLPRLLGEARTAVPEARQLLTQPAEPLQSVAVNKKKALTPKNQSSHGFQRSKELFESWFNNGPGARPLCQFKSHECQMLCGQVLATESARFAHQAECKRLFIMVNLRVTTGVFFKVLVFPVREPRHAFTLVRLSCDSQDANRPTGHPDAQWKHTGTEHDAAVFRRFCETPTDTSASLVFSRHAMLRMERARTRFIPCPDRPPPERMESLRPVMRLTTAVSSAIEHAFRATNLPLTLHLQGYDAFGCRRDLLYDFFKRSSPFNIVVSIHPREGAAGPVGWCAFEGLYWIRFNSKLLERHLDPADEYSSSVAEKFFQQLDRLQAYKDALAVARRSFDFLGRSLPSRVPKNLTFDDAGEALAVLEGSSSTSEARFVCPIFQHNPELYANVPKHLWRCARGPFNMVCLKMHIHHAHNDEYDRCDKCLDSRGHNRDADTALEHHKANCRVTIAPALRDIVLLSQSMVVAIWDSGRNEGRKTAAGVERGIIWHKNMQKMLYPDAPVFEPDYNPFRDSTLALSKPWYSECPFPACDVVFMIETFDKTMNDHLRLQHAGEMTEQERKVYMRQTREGPNATVVKCPIPGCSGVTKSFNNMVTHLREQHAGEMSKQDREIYMRQTRDGPDVTIVKCPVPGCVAVNKSVSNMLTHLKLSHPDIERRDRAKLINELRLPQQTRTWECPIKTCTNKYVIFTSLAGLAKHLGTRHSREMTKQQREAHMNQLKSEAPPHWQCPVSGCDLAYYEFGFLNTHLKKNHDAMMSADQGKTYRQGINEGLSVSEVWSRIRTPAS